MADITIKDVYELIESLRSDVFSAINHDREACRERHKNIDTDISIIKTINGEQEKKHVDVEQRLREVQIAVYKASAIITFAVVIVGIIMKFI